MTGIPGELDLHLIAEGRHERLWEVLGAHPLAAAGYTFAVWAPRAQAAGFIGDATDWAAVPMKRLGSGVWFAAIESARPGQRYKFRIHGTDGSVVDHADPLAFRTETPPATASVIDASRHRWGDDEWAAGRARHQGWQRPLSIYECHPGSWRPGLSYRELAVQLAEYVVDLGFTHVELLPIAEHPYGGSWGYQVTSYFAPTARFGEPDDVRFLIDYLHQAGIGVIVDWVPAHFPKDQWALARFDGGPLYEHGDPMRGEQLDWGTYVFDFGRSEVRNFLVASALFWLSEFHVDGLRVDAVASMLYLDYSKPDGGWTPNIHGGRENLEAVAFLQELTATVHKLCPGVLLIAEESTSWPGVTRPATVGGLGFSMKWNMGWMHDLLGYLGRDPVHRSHHHNEITFSLMYAWNENYVLPISHDEVVHGKGTLWSRMPGDDFAKAAGVRVLLAYMWAHPGKQLLFMGQEFGQRDEWSEQHGLDWGLLDDPAHQGIQSVVRDLNSIYRTHPALWEQDSLPAGFSWIDANDNTSNVLSFIRISADGAMVVCLFNFAGAVHPNYRVGLPTAGRWLEILNTDATAYGGAGIGNYGAVTATSLPWHGRPASAELALPANSAIWLKSA